MPETTLRVITKWEEMEPLADKWNALLPQRPHRSLFMRFDFLRLWWQHFGEGRRLHVIVFEENDTAVGAVPFVFTEARKGAVTYSALELMGTGATECATLPIPADRTDLIAPLFDHIDSLASGWDTMRLDELVVGDPISDEITLEAERRGFPIDSRCSALCPHLPLDRPFEELWQGLFKAKGRSDRKRKMRQLESKPGLETHQWVDGMDLDTVLTTFAELEQTSWKGQEGIGLFAPSCRDWHCALIHQMMAQGEAILHWHTVDGRAVSYRVGFVWDGVFYDFNTAYHPDVAKLSPSSVTLIHLVEELAERGIEWLDFCRGVQRYKLEWATGLRENRTVRIFNHTASGRLLSGLIALKQMSGKTSDDRPELPIPLKAPLA